MSERSIFSLNNVGVNYKSSLSLFKRDDYWALNDVSFEVRSGETLGIVGKNGAGKSTLMKVMAGIIDPDRGFVSKNEMSVLLLSLQVGFMPHLSGAENAILSGILLGMRKAKVSDAMDEIVAFSELGDFIYKPVRTYSAGMKARLGFAVALQVNPDVLLMDEVLSVGDEQFRKKSLEAMNERIRSDKTVVLISHNEATIREYCDRVVWIKDGCSYMDGTPQVVLGEYSKFNELN
ncbi:MAG: lipopolysaccharide transport system ATP-binding protein [Pseudomonadales bacterium]|jgi:lipopolysaccharide transport system ATP-binding protein